jgi:hypothetical protein
MPSYEATILADSPGGYWRLNDSGSTATDSSGNAQHGTYRSPTGTTHDASSPITNTTVAGSYRWAIGDATWLTVPSPFINFAGNTVTVEAWVKNIDVTPPTFRYVFALTADSLDDGSHQGFAMQTGSAGALIGLFSEPGGLHATGTITSPWNGNWHHLVYRYDGSVDDHHSIFVDGAEVSGSIAGSFTQNILASGNTGGPYDATIGSWATTGGSTTTLAGPSLSLAGYYCELAIYGTALSPATIAAHYAAAATAAAAGPTPQILRTSRLVY